MRPSSARQRSSRRFTLLLVLGAVAVLALALLFNRNGLLAISQLQRMQESETRSIDTLSREVDSLRIETGRLQGDSAFIEKAVREILGWGRPDEFVIRIIPRRSSEGSN
jgi:cell division protein FtsB